MNLSFVGDKFLVMVVLLGKMNQGNGVVKLCIWR